MFKSKRLYFNIAAFASLFLLPWWVGIIVGLVALWKYVYYEFIVIGFLLDILYGSTVIWKNHYIYPPLFFTWFAFIAFIAFQVVKKKVRLH